jgi:hypothetical protein
VSAGYPIFFAKKNQRMPPQSTRERGLLVERESVFWLTSGRPGEMQMKITVACCALVVALCSLSNSSDAGMFYTGSELYGGCANFDPNTADTWKNGVCYGYVMGVIDNLDSVQRAEHICVFAPPMGMRAPVTVGIVQKYLKEHPDQLQLSADSLIGVAMAHAFPCPK